MNMIKVLRLRFLQCLVTFTMLLVEGYSETILFRDLYDHVIGGCSFENRKSMRVIFFFKIFKIYSSFQKRSKKMRNVFLFWGNSILIGIVKLVSSLLRTGYFSSSANVLKSCPKIWPAYDRDFLQHNWLSSDQSIC